MLLSDKKMFAHTKEVMGEAMREKDSSLNHEIFSHSHSHSQAQSASPGGTTGVHEALKGHIRHRTTSADEHIVTMERKITRKLSLLMLQRGKVLEGLNGIQEGESDQEDSDEDDEESRERGIERLKERGNELRKLSMSSGGAGTGKAKELEMATPMAKSTTRKSLITQAKGMKSLIPEKWRDLKKTQFAPHYTIAEVKHFLDCFRFVDKNMSGEIDVDEWQEFLKGMSQDMTQTESRRLFMHIDENHNGAISISEGELKIKWRIENTRNTSTLTPCSLAPVCKVVFNKASGHQLKIMVHIMTNELNRDLNSTHSGLRSDNFDRKDLRELFHIYDEKNERHISIKKILTSFTALNIDEGLVMKLFHDAGYEDAYNENIDVETFVDVIYCYLSGQKNRNLAISGY